MDNDSGNVNENNKMGSRGQLKLVFKAVLKDLCDLLPTAFYKSQASTTHPLCYVALTTKEPQAVSPLKCSKRYTRAMDQEH